MSQAQDQAGLIEDLARLARKGSGDHVLEACTTLMSLRPVSLAVQGGALASLAGRTLLELVARDVKSSLHVRAAAALTGVDPPDTGRGVRSDSGPGPRQEEAGRILGGLSARTMRQAQHAQRCYREYANAILGFVRAASHDHQLLDSYLAQCGVNDDVGATTNPPEVASTHTPSRSSRSGRSSSGTADDGSGSHARLARLVSLSGVVREALDAARTSCAARGRPFYTPDLLIALLDIPNSRTAQCLEEVQPGLAQRVREWLDKSLRAVSEGRESLFHSFEWNERPDVQLAQDLAFSDGMAVVTEVYMLLGVLGSESNTRSRLAVFLGPVYDHLCVAANARRRSNEHVLKTPGLKTWAE
jgi:hypothetical protein